MISGGVRNLATVCCVPCGVVRAIDIVTIDNTVKHNIFFPLDLSLKEHIIKLCKVYNFNIENKLLNLRELLQSIGNDRAHLVVVCVHVFLKFSSILVVFSQDLFDHRASEGLVSCSAILLDRKSTRLNSSHRL